MRIRSLTVVAGLVVFATLFVLPAGALAQEASVETTVGGYDVDFTLPTAAKSGCLVCHGDENLIRLREDEIVSFYVDPAQLEAGPHATVQCSGCHLDFAFTLPHVQEAEEWQNTAKSACKNCHQDQYVEYGQGVHRPDVGNGESADADEKPLCGDCHGSHDIVALVDSPEGQQAMRDNAYEICGRCHQDYWDNYDDYYHGRGFKAGAYDAPSCWDCHGYHDIRPSDDRLSRVHESRLAETCTSGDACHDDVNDGYLDYADLIHGQREAYDQNPLLAIFNRIRAAIFGLFSG
jgi:hypothetical protein